MAAAALVGTKTTDTRTWNVLDLSSRWQYFMQKGVSWSTLFFFVSHHTVFFGHLRTPIYLHDSLDTEEAAFFMWCILARSNGPRLFS